MSRRASTAVALTTVTAFVGVWPSYAQEPDQLQSRVMAVVREAVRPALPFPDTDEDGSVPANGSPAPLWMVRPVAAGDRTIEVLANPLNEVNQARATRAMAQIENAIEAAQRRSQAQYERAIAEAKRTGRSQDVDGVTLADEGVAGAKIDAESHVTIDVSFNQPSYALTLAASVEPAFAKQVTVPGATVIALPSHVYRERGNRGDEERFAQAESQVFFRVTGLEIKKTSDTSFEIAGTGAADGAQPVRSIVLRLTGNDVLIAEILRKTDWNELLELLK